ncbi:MAG: hypothetical protein ACNI26_13190 [Terasakiella sp.]|uniref:hypothetical protein n=1 Tax=unclassified Terasakiella TaxID=2614952 RepID=UPI003AFF8475
MNFELLEIVFSHAVKDDVMFVNIDDVAEGVIQTHKARDGSVYEIEYVPHEGFEEAIAGLESIGILHEVQDANNEITRAYNTRYEKVIEYVHYKKGATYCWERFGKCKELCQSILSNELNRTNKYSSLETLFEHLANDYLPKPQNEKDEAAILIEKLGIQTAIEVLFPLKYRVYFITEIQKADGDLDDLRERLKAALADQVIDESETIGNLITNGCDPLTLDAKQINPEAVEDLIALLFRIPQQYMDIALSPKYNRVCLALAKDLNPSRFGELEL